VPEGSPDGRRALSAIARGAVIWGTIGLGVALLVCGVVLSAWALLLVRHALGPALMLGVLHGAWMYTLRGTPLMLDHPEPVGALSGVVVGSLGFLPVFVVATPMTYPWLAVAIFAAAALLGGACAGAVTARVVARPTGVTQPFRASRFLAPAAAWIVLAGGELVVWGPRAGDRLPARRLVDADVLDLSPGSATGVARSGVYQIATCGIDGAGGGGGGTAEVTQSDGRLRMRWMDQDFAGGVDSTGQFRAAARATSSGGQYVERWLLTGRFLNDSLFEAELRNQVDEAAHPSGRVMISRGYGRRNGQVWQTSPGPWKNPCRL
jgi:hypothetical protein